jgi:hypothetical protein
VGRNDALALLIAACAGIALLVVYALLTQGVR